MKNKPKLKPRTKRKNKKRKVDWRTNDMIITEAFCNLLIQYQRAPSYAEVARRVGNIDEKTVARHLQEVDFEQRFKQFRAGSPKVIANLFRQAISTKNHQLIRLWLELFEGLGDKKVDITTGGEKLPSMPSNISTLSFEQLLQLANSGNKSTDSPGSKA